MTAYEALRFFAAHKTIAKRLQLLCDVGLDYLKLGQPSTTLSGGEAQRIKLLMSLQSGEIIHCIFLMNQQPDCIPVILKSYWWF